MRSAAETAGTSGRPLRRDAERNRRRILEAAGEVFAERGLSASLDDVARHAQVGVGTVYRRFPDKQLLIDALFEERVAAVVAAFAAGLEHPDPWEGLAGSLERVLQMQADDRGLQELLLSGARACGTIDGARKQVLPLVERLLQRAQADGSARDDVTASDLPLLQMMIGALVDATRDIDPEVWRRFLALQLDGLRASRERPTPLPGRALGTDALDCAMGAWRPSR